MAELPGWDRDRLATADERDVVAARLLVYARARAPEIRRDLASQIRQLELSAMSPAAARVAIGRERDSDLRALRQAKQAQTELRAVLELDDVDEEPA
jgi:hypothetical protein